MYVSLTFITQHRIHSYYIVAAGYIYTQSRESYLRTLSFHVGINFMKKKPVSYEQIYIYHYGLLNEIMIQNPFTCYAFMNRLTLWKRNQFHKNVDH